MQAACLNIKQMSPDTDHPHTGACVLRAAAATAVILVIDLGKYKSIACVSSGAPPLGQSDVAACCHRRRSESMGGAAYPDGWGDTVEGVCPGAAA